MISILIPIYNFDVRSLVNDLHNQAESCNIKFEIICYDDDSETKYKELNQQIENMEHVVYYELSKNIGRAKIRNGLASRAQYKNLLFMDCDSMVNSKSFIQNYINTISNECVVVGGRKYSSHPPAEKKKYFRWYYGIHREQQPVNIRSSNPYKSFMSNNFMVTKSIMNNIMFNEQIAGYGHEDTCFGLELKKRNIPVIHIDNPLTHVQLETVEEFLGKSKNAVSNLFSLFSEYDLKLLSKEISLIKYFRIIKKSGLDNILIWIFNLLKGYIEKNLASDHPRLYLFDFYKLGLLLIIEKKICCP